MSWTPEDKVIWDNLSPTLKAKFRDIVKDAIKNYLKDKGFLSDMLEKAFFINLPPKINTSDNTTLDITTVNGTKTPVVVKFDPKSIDNTLYAPEIGIAKSSLPLLSVLIGVSLPFTISPLINGVNRI